MRNLKRVLSLLMAAAMLIGMMVIGASAADTYEDFTDKDEITNTEAVNTMVSLGVINGKDDGSYFDPTGIVTRAEMAALIARCLNGGIDPSLGTGAAATTFSDTQGHWAEAYIAYCANLGIINGKGDGTFGPDETVTGTAAAKMFLCALGYRADIEKLTGAGWDLNTDTLANKVGLYDRLETLTPSEGLNRDNTAQLIYNGVQAYEVEYRNNYGEYSGVIYAQEQNTMLASRFKVVKVTGILEANDKVSVADGVRGTNVIPGHDRYNVALEGESLVRVTGVSGYTYGANNGQNNNLFGARSFKVATSDEMVGQEIVLYVKALDYLSPNAITSTVVGNPILTENNTVVETTGRLKDEAAVRTALRNGGMSNIGTPVEFLYTEQDVIASTNGGPATRGVTDEITKYVRDNENARSAGIFQRFIDNDGNGYPDYIVQIVPVLSSVNSINANDETYTFTGITSAIPFADVVTDEDLARSDVILFNRFADDRYYVSYPETVEGTVTAYNTNNNNVTVDGANYGNSGGKRLAVGGVDQILVQDMVDNTYTFYLDPYGNVLGFIETEAVVGNYCVVQGYSVSGNDRMGWTARVKLLLQDGTTGTYDVNMPATAVRLGVAESTASDINKQKAIAYKGVSGTDVQDYFGDASDPADGTKLVDHLFSYTLDNGTVTLARPFHVNNRYTSNKVVSGSLNTTGDLNGSVTKISKNTTTYALASSDGTYNNGTIVANNQTVFFIKDKDGKYYAVSGLTNLPTVDTDIGAVGGTTAKESISYLAPNSSTQLAKAIFVTSNQTFKTAQSYVFVTNKYTHSTASGTPIYTFDVVNADGEVSKMTTTENINSIKETVREYFQDGSYMSFDPPSGGEKGDHRYTYDNVYVADYKNGVVTLNDVETEAFVASYRVDGAAKIWDVQGSTPTSSNLTVNDKVAVRINQADGGVIDTVFIYDVMNGAFADAAAPGSVIVTNPGSDPVDPADDLSTTPGGTWTGMSNANAAFTLRINVPSGSEIDSVSVFQGPDRDHASELSRQGNATTVDGVWTGNYALSGANQSSKVFITVVYKAGGKDNKTVNYDAIIMPGTMPAADPTANITIKWQADGTAGGSQPAATPGAVAVGPIDNGVTSVILTLGTTADHTVAKDNDGGMVTLGTAGANQTVTVNTSSVASTGGTVTFDLTVTEVGKTAITYNVTVTVAGSAPGGSEVVVTPGGTDAETTTAVKDAIADANNANKTLTLDGNFTSTEAVTLNAGQTLKVTGNVNDVAGAITGGDLEVVDGTYTTAQTTINNDITITADQGTAKMHLNGTNVTLAGTVSTPQLEGTNVTVTGKLTTTNNDATGTITVNSNEAGTVLSVDTVADKLTVTKGNVSVSSAVASNGVELAATAGTVTIGGAITGNVVVAGGELVAAAADVSSLTLTDGKATVKSVTTTFSDAAGTEVTVKNDIGGITTIAGKVTFESAVTLTAAVTVTGEAIFDDVAVTATETITVDAAGKVTVNGVLASEDVIVGDADGATLEFGDAASLTGTATSKLMKDDGSGNATAIDKSTELAGSIFTWDDTNSCWMLQTT